MIRTRKRSRRSQEGGEVPKNTEKTTQRELKVRGTGRFEEKKYEKA